MDTSWHTSSNRLAFSRLNFFFFPTTYFSSFFISRESPFSIYSRWYHFQSQSRVDNPMIGWGHRWRCDVSLVVALLLWCHLTEMSDRAKRVWEPPLNRWSDHLCYNSTVVSRVIINIWSQCESFWVPTLGLLFQTGFYAGDVDSRLFVLSCRAISALRQQVKLYITITIYITIQGNTKRIAFCNFGTRISTDHFFFFFCLGFQQFIIFCSQ